MKIKLENREYELKANGAFMKKYQETFNENMVVALFKATQQQDIYTVSKLTYCAINEEMPFDEWLESFDDPLFLITEMADIIEYLVRHSNATVKTEDDESEVKKKMTN